jgi:hypothetical protein
MAERRIIPAAREMRARSFPGLRIEAVNVLEVIVESDTLEASPWIGVVYLITVYLTRLPDQAVTHDEVWRPIPRRYEANILRWVRHGWPVFAKDEVLTANLQDETQPRLASPDSGAPRKVLPRTPSRVLPQCKRFLAGSATQRLVHHASSAADCKRRNAQGRGRASRGRGKTLRNLSTLQGWWKSTIMRASGAWASARFWASMGLRSSVTFCNRAYKLRSVGGSHSRRR